MSSSDSTENSDFVEGPRFSQVTLHNHQAGLWIITSLSLCYAFVILGMRMIVKWKFYALDDLVLAAAYIISLAQWIAMYAALDLGLGKDTTLLDSATIATAAKLVFAARLMVLVAVSLSKCCILLFIRQLFTKENKKAWKLCTISLSVVACWAVASALVISVGCSPRETLQGDSVTFCSANAIRWKLVTALDVVFEAILVILPCYLFSSVRMNMKRKATVISAFAFRVVVAAFFIAWLESYLSFLDHGKTSIGMVSTLNWQEILLSYSLMSATIPCLKGFLGRFQTGDLARLSENDTQFYGYGSQKSQPGSKGQSYALDSIKSKIEQKRGSNVPEVGFSGFRGDNPQHTANAFAIQRNGDDSSTRSDGSEQMIIHRRVDWDVVPG